MNKINTWAHSNAGVPKLLNLISVKMVPYINENKLIVDASLDMCILLSDIAIVIHLQDIHRVYCLSSVMTNRILSVSSIYTLINMLASNHAIKLVSPRGVPRF